MHEWITDLSISEAELSREVMSINKHGNLRNPFKIIKVRAINVPNALGLLLTSLVKS